jgi:hypothetical protein
MGIHLKPRTKEVLESWCENCKLIWNFQTDMKIANWYGNCKEILTFRCMVPTWTFVIFIWETQQDWKLVLERISWLDCVWMTKTHRRQSLAKPSTNHILILIPLRRQPDSYFKRWFLRSPWFFENHCFMLYLLCYSRFYVFFLKNFWFTILVDSWFWRIVNRICWACTIFCLIPNLQACTDGRTDRRTN